MMMMKVGPDIPITLMFLIAPLITIIIIALCEIVHGDDDDSDDEMKRNTIQINGYE